MFRMIHYVIFILAFASSSAHSEDLRFLNYDGFHLVVDCDLRSAVLFTYTIGPDTGTLDRGTSFNIDPDFPPECQQISNNSYSNESEPSDRGHMVPANHLDHLQTGIYQSNYMTNVLPQAKKMNRGAWLRTEKIIECFREKSLLHVYGGLIYGPSRNRDFFTESHGIKTARAFWKVVISDTDHIAWIIPNTSNATHSELNNYLVSINKIDHPS